MATVVLQDLSVVISVPLGTAAKFRGQINDNFTVLKDASQQLQNMVGEWDETDKGTITERLKNNSKLYIGTQDSYNIDIEQGLQLYSGDIWFKILEDSSEEIEE